MARFYLPPSAVRGTSFTLSGSEAHHALHVLRKKVGDEIDLFDGKDASFTGRIERISESEIHGSLTENRVAAAVPVRVRLFQALTRGTKWEWLVEKACEIGVDAVIPVLSQRTLIKLEHDQLDDKLERWNRLALAASKQSGRARIMAVERPQPFSNAVAQLSVDELSLIPWEKETVQSIRQACETRRAAVVNVFIGPEGGWEAGEVELAKNHGVLSVRLGPTLLRTETAGLIAAALVFREFGVY